MLPFASVFSSSSLGAVSFTVQRKVYTLTQGEPVLSFTTQYAATGCIHPAAAADLKLTDTEDRRDDRIVIYTPFTLSLGRNASAQTFTAPDEILWNDNTYRLTRVKDWSPLGFTEGWAVRQIPATDSASSDTPSPTEPVPATAGISEDTPSPPEAMTATAGISEDTPSPPEAMTATAGISGEGCP